jgi:hypothetical protein
VSEHVMTRSSVPIRRRMKLVAAAVGTALVVAGGVSMTACGAAGSASRVTRSATATPGVSVPTTDACGSSDLGFLRSSDIGYLVAAVAAMPPQVSARVVGSLSPELSEVFGVATFLTLPAPPDTATLGSVLLRLDAGDARAIASGLPAPQQGALAAVEADESGPLGGLGWLSPCG